MIGDQISHYRLESKLGSGTYGVVYRGVHVGDDELKVAIKVIQPALLDDPKFVESLKKECRRLNKLDHTAIVRFRDLILGDDQVAMVLELLEGKDLHDHIQDGPIPLSEAAEIIEKALSGLAYAHSKEVIHRDIKPSNIFLCDDARVKILDFGIARAAQNTQATQTGTMKGTLDYMAPERFRATGGGCVSDVYAMGLVAWELVAGQPACPAGGLPEKLGWHLGVGPTRLETVRADCPGWLADVVAQMTAMDPEARLADGEAALSAFRSGRSAGGPAKPASRPAERPAAPSTVTLRKEDVAEAIKQVEAPRSTPGATVAPSTVVLKKQEIAQAVKEVEATTPQPAPEPAPAESQEPPASPVAAAPTPSLATPAPSAPQPSSEDTTWPRTYRADRAFLNFLPGFTFRIFAEGQLAFYVKQRAFKLKEDIVIFADTARRRPRLRIQGQTILNFSSSTTYDITDTRIDEKVGAFQRQEMRSLVRDTWHILDVQDQVIGTIVEDSGIFGLLRRIVPWIPKNLTVRIGDTVVGSIKQRFSLFRMIYSVRTQDNKGLDPRLGVAMSILLMARPR